MKPCTIRDLPVLAEIFNIYYGEDRTLWIREKLYSPYHFLFLFDDSVAIYYEMINESKHCIHLVGNTNKIKGLRNTIIEAGDWVVHNTPSTSVIAFVSEDNKRLQMFIGLAGGKRECIIDGEVLYSFYKKDRDNILRRVKWQ